MWHLLPFSFRKSRWGHKVFFSGMTLIRAYSNIANNLGKFLHRSSSENELPSIDEMIRGKDFILSWPTYDWRIPLKQRPQHIAESLARCSEMFYLFTTRNLYDQVTNYEKISDRLFLIKDFWAHAPKASYIHLYATDPHLTLKHFKRIEKLKVPIIYEILDAIDYDLQGGDVEGVKIRHQYAMQSKLTRSIIITAENLRSSIPKDLHYKIKYLPNACDSNHFKLREIRKEKEEFSIGYFGALASWFDYDLVSQIAVTNPKWRIQLIGIDYDGSLQASGLLSIPNVVYLGVVDYEFLPGVVDFDVAILPFKINEITRATSPIKIYEYLSLGLPVVSTPLPECEKIDLVVTANDAKSFSKILIECHTLDNLEQRMVRREFALKNSWDARSLEYIENKEKINV